MWIYKLERKIGWFSIPHLMFFIVVGSSLVYVFDLIAAFQGNNIYLSSMLYFNRYLIFQGQIWRLVTFVFIPPAGSTLFVLLGLYFYYFVGTSLESVWGNFKFTIYYLLGIIGSILSGLITGYSTATFLNLSLFFAFSVLYPELKVLLFFIIPVKVKWLGIIDAVFFFFSIIISLISSDWSSVLAAIMAIINLLIFLGPKLFKDIFNKIKYKRSQQEFMKKTKNSWRS